MLQSEAPMKRGSRKSGGARRNNYIGAYQFRNIHVHLLILMRTYLGLRTAIYHVPDLDKAKEWYSGVLMTQPYFDQPFYVGFNVGGFELGLDPNMNGVTKGTTVDVYWGIDDCKGEYNRLLEMGATAHHEPQDVGEGIIVATVLDPFGNVFGIIENPNFTLPAS